MKSLMTLLAVMMVSVATMFGQATTNLVKSITCDNSNVVFALPGTTTVNEWDENYIRVTCAIEVTNTSEAVLTKLVTLGRYNIEVKAENGSTTISAPKMANHIAIQGTDLLENVRYEISVPRGTKSQVLPVSYGNVLQAL